MASKIYDQIKKIEDKLAKSQDLDEKLFVEAYNSVIKLAYPLLPTVCRIEILTWLSPLGTSREFTDVPECLPKSTLAYLLQDERYSKIFTPTLLPEARIWKQVAENVHFQCQYNELRRSFRVTFQFSNANHISRECLFYIVCVVGSVEDYKILTQMSRRTKPQKFCRPAFYLALKYGNVALIRYLLDDVKVCNQHQIKPRMLSIMLAFAAEFGYLGIVQDLVRAYPTCDPTLDYNYAIRRAAEGGHLDILDYLWHVFDARLDLTANTSEALRQAASNGHLAVVKYLVEKMGTTHGLDDAVFELAAERGHVHVLEYLIEHVPSIDPATSDNYPFQIAADNGHLPVMKYLLSLDPMSYDIDPRANSEMALKVAAYGGYLDIVKYLIEQVSECWSRTESALDNAERMGHTKIVEYLRQRIFHHPISLRDYIIRQEDGTILELPPIPHSWSGDQVD